MAASVRVGPGATVLTRIPLPPNAAAQDRVRDSSAALVAAYTGASAELADAAVVETLTTTPDPRAIIFGSSAAGRKNGARTLTSNIISNESTFCSRVGAKGNAAAFFTSTATSHTVCPRV